MSVYKIVCIENNKIYIGSSINTYKRWHNHRYELNNNKHHSPYLQRAWNKYGENKFTFQIIEKNEKNLLVEKEQFWMDLYKSYDPKFGFNSNAKAEGNHSRKWTAEQRIKYSKSRKGKKASPALSAALQKIRKVGSKSNLSSINEEKVLSIISSLNEGKTPNTICLAHNVGISLVRAIYQRRTWTHLTKDLYIKLPGSENQRNKVSKLNKENVKIIKIRLLNGESHLDISKEYGVSRTTILDIKKNKTWKDV